jgi:tetracycline repressor-like protein
MPKPSHREKLLAAGLHVVHEQGYCGASVRDIVQAAGVPQGSFTNHFRSKEAFCLEVLERYFSLVRENIEKTLRNGSTAPLQRLRAWVDLQIRYLEQAGMRNGCLIGNYGVEASHPDAPFSPLIVPPTGELSAMSVSSGRRFAVHQCPHGGGHWASADGDQQLVGPDLLWSIGRLDGVVTAVIAVEPASAQSTVLIHKPGDAVRSGSPPVRLFR